MNNKKVKMITLGAMLAAVYGVLGLFNLLFGSTIDILICLFIAIVTSLYTIKYDYKAAIVLVITSSVIFFIEGELFFLFFCGLTMLMGVYYGALDRREVNDNITLIGLFFLSIFKYGFLFFGLGSLFGYDVIHEFSIELREIGMLPIKGTGSVILMVIAIIIIMGIMEVIIITGYSMRIRDRYGRLFDRF